MKRIRLIILVSTLFIGIMSCSRDSVNVQEEPINSVGLGKEVKIKATFKDIKGISVSRDVTTRVSNSSWDSGDAIGLFMKRANTDLILPSLANNIKYTTDGNTDIFDTKHKIYFPINKQKVDFIAYYPYIENLNGLNYPIDVSNQSDFYDSEFMYSNNAKGYNSEDEIVKLEFQPQSVKLIVKIYDKANDTILDLNKNNIKVKISNVHTKANFNLSDATFDVLTGENYVSDIIFTINNNVAEAILLPETNFNGIVLVINNNGKTHSLPLLDSVHSDDELIESFLQSHEYDFSIDLIGSNIDGDITATIKDRNKVIIDRITLPEDPVIDEKPDNGDETNEEEGPIDGDTNPGDNEDPILTDPDDPGKENNPDNPAVYGDGTQQNPYSIAQIIEMEDSKDDIWIKGYIAGFYKNSFEVLSTDISILKDWGYLSLALADSPLETSHEFALPVKIVSTLAHPYNKLNLKDNYENLQKEILLRGDIGEWNLDRKLNTPRTSVVNLKEAFLEGEKI